MSDLAVETTAIPGLLVVRLPVHADARGWFKENWQRAKMTALGLPDFEPVQHNVAFNARRGTTRGVHTEPWDKFVSVTGGRAFGAWVDMREGDSFGTVVTCELDPATAVFVPRGVGNSYQTLDDAVAYTYLVNDHWRAGEAYPALDLADPDAAIAWPIPLAEAEVSEKDRSQPRLAEVTPMAPRTPLVLGANGQVGRALLAALPGAVGVGRDELDVTDADAVAAWPWHRHDVVLNAAAYTAVDAAETPEGRPAAWAANAAAPAALARVADAHRLTLVHYSTEYVFDGTRGDHVESEPVSPLGVYAQSKAAGELAATTAKRHYVLRTSWVVGEGGNFVRTMARLAAGGVSPSVVDDQVGRLTFADELVRATRHLLDATPERAPYGVYHVSNGGEPTTWADVAAAVFEAAGRDPGDVVRVSTAEYAAGKTLAPRPARSDFDLAKLRSTGFEPAEALPALRRYVAGLG
ncbi:bifunctional dTDP-4-dehydrorhamnose 3,5-epimerase family protein/NAD(P)-dependent oxidoreductase [Nocardioides marinquilinus]|uniref:dTDP-4-dehydrorhamnose reductase n=1 Tax=Nocardioides marinquilinus TaxID=1210400 RepID=A0ABP9PKJ4_9ACTN